MGVGPRSVSRNDRSRHLDAVASRQIRLVTAGDAIGVGFSRSGIDKRIRNGRLHPLHVGVYATHPPPYTREQLWLAAVLACGAGALLSDWQAASHLRIVPSSVSPAELPVHVTVPPGNGSRSRPGIVVHRRGPIDPRDARRRESIPITSPELTLVHLAPTVEPIVLAQLLSAAESWRGLSRRRLAELVLERRGRPGVAKLAGLLEQRPALVRSDLELLFLPVIERSGVAMPSFNHPVAVPGRERPLKVDLAWPSIRLVVELDSQRFHGDWQQAELDRERDQLLTLAGWQSHRFVRRRVARDVAGSARRLRALVDTRLSELRGRSVSDLRT